MGIEQLNKEELVKILEDKQETLSLLKEKRDQEAYDYMTPEFRRALMTGRCRLCVGTVIERMLPIPGDPDGKVKKTITHTGTPYAESRGGNKLACRTCKHVRQALRDAGVTDVFI